MSVPISAAAIILALVVFFVLCYRGLGVIPCAVLCAAIVSVTTEAGLFGSLTVCAKSGTAERENGPADAMFAGFVEDEAYPLAFVVFAERGGSGSQTAAPIAAKVLAACKTMLDTPNPNG